MENVLTRELQEQHRKISLDAQNLHSGYGSSPEELSWVDPTIRVVTVLLGLASILHLVVLTPHTSSTQAPIYWTGAVCLMIVLRVLWMRRILPGLRAKEIGLALRREAEIREERKQWWESVGALLSHRGELQTWERSGNITQAGEELLSGDENMTLRPVGISGEVWLISQDGRVVTSQTPLRCSQGTPLEAPRSVVDDELQKMWVQRQGRAQEDAQKLMKAALAAGGRTSGRVLHLLATAAAVLFSMILDREGAQDLPLGEEMSLFAAQAIGAVVSGDLSSMAMGPGSLFLMLVLVCIANLFAHLAWCRGLQRAIVLTKLSRLSQQLMDTSEMERQWWIQAEHRLRISGLWPVRQDPSLVNRNWWVHVEGEGHISLHDESGPATITRTPVRWTEVIDELTGTPVAMVSTEVEEINLHSKSSGSPAPEKTSS